MSPEYPSSTRLGCSERAGGRGLRATHVDKPVGHGSGAVWTEDVGGRRVVRDGHPLLVLGQLAQVLLVGFPGRKQPREAGSRMVPQVRYRVCALGEAGADGARAQTRARPLAAGSHVHGPTSARWPDASSAAATGALRSAAFTS